MKNKKEFPIHLLFLFFLVIIIVSIFLILNKKRKISIGQTLQKVTKNGAFVIEAPDEIGVSNPFNVRFVADSKNKNANAVALYIEFDPEIVSVLNIDTSNSFCQFYPESKFDNNKGLISIQCGSPSPGFKGQNTIASVSFMAKSIGSSSFKIDERSMILLDNGKGENIYSDLVEKKFIILNTI